MDVAKYRKDERTKLTKQFTVPIEESLYVELMRLTQPPFQQKVRQWVRDLIRTNLPAYKQAIQANLLDQRAG